MNPIVGNFSGSEKIQKVRFVPRPIEKKYELLNASIMSNQFDGFKNMLFDNSMSFFMKLVQDLCQGNLITYSFYIIIIFFRTYSKSRAFKGT